MSAATSAAANAATNAGLSAGAGSGTGWVLVLAGVAALGLLCYLVYALLRAEDF